MHRCRKSDSQIIFKRMPIDRIVSPVKEERWMLLSPRPLPSWPLFPRAPSCQPLPELLAALRVDKLLEIKTTKLGFPPLP
jgi:hypothetical protein